MAGHGEKRSRLQEKAIASLISTESVPEAAKKTGVGERTLWRWIKDVEEFKVAYAAARRELVRHAIIQVQRNMGRAVKALMEIIESKDAPASSRVSAARTILEFGIRAVEVEDLEKRVAQLEALLENG
jgi:hypothetical protein